MGVHLLAVWSRADTGGGGGGVSEATSRSRSARAAVDGPLGIFAYGLRRRSRSKRLRRPRQFTLGRCKSGLCTPALRAKLGFRRPDLNPRLGQGRASDRKACFRHWSVPTRKHETVEHGQNCAFGPRYRPRRPGIWSMRASPPPCVAAQPKTIPPAGFMAPEGDGRRPSSQLAATALWRRHPVNRQRDRLPSAGAGLEHGPAEGRHAGGGPLEIETNDTAEQQEQQHNHDLQRPTRSPSPGRAWASDWSLPLSSKRQTTLHLGLHRGSVVSSPALRAFPYSCLP